MNLRQWQSAVTPVFKQRVIDAWHANLPMSFLLEACPGAGKTFQAGLLARWMLDQRYARRIIVRVPTAHLRQQWAASLSHAHGLFLDWEASKPSEWIRRSDCHGAVITYAMLAQNPSAWVAPARDAFTINDEVHHAGEGAAWGNAMLQADAKCKQVLNLSGTPFRSDTLAIPHVRYDKGESQPDYRYGLSDALRDRVIRPICFFTYGGQVTIGSEHIDLNEAGEVNRQSRRLALCLHPDGGWLRDVLSRANSLLGELRQTHRDAGGLVVCRDREHARAVATLIAEISGRRPPVVLSDDPRASSKITAFADSAEPWLVSVRMVSEGIDLPRLRVGVFATNITTAMFFRQYIGRITRVTHKPPQTAYCFLPNDLRIVKHAEQILNEIRHHIHGRAAVLSSAEASPAIQLTAGAGEVESAENAASSQPDAATLPDEPLKISGSASIRAIHINGHYQPALLPSLQPEPSQLVSVIDQRVSALQAQPVSQPAASYVADHKERERVSAEIRRLVSRVVRKTGQSHAHVRASLNRQQGVKSQAECSLQQLRSRRQLLTLQLR